MELGTHHLVNNKNNDQRSSSDQGDRSPRIHHNPETDELKGSESKTATRVETRNTHNGKDNGVNKRLRKERPL